MKIELQKKKIEDEMSKYFITVPVEDLFTEFATEKGRILLFLKICLDLIFQMNLQLEKAGNDCTDNMSR